jgi:hypothetical protein
MSQGWIQNERVTPYGAPIVLSSQTSTTSDITIMKTFPGLGFNGTETNAVFFEEREVAGDFWFVTNATFEPPSPATGNQWTQIIASVPSYAMVLRATGVIERLSAPAGASTPIAWTSVWMLDPKGRAAFTTTTVTDTTPSILAEPTWNSAGMAMLAIQARVTDVASSASSLLEDLQVNGASMWSVRKDGTLVAGTVPYARVSGTPSNPVLLDPASQQSGAININGIVTAAGLKMSGYAYNANITNNGTDALYRSFKSGGGHIFQAYDGTSLATISSAAVFSIDTIDVTHLVVATSASMPATSFGGAITGSTIVITTQINVGSTAIASTAASFGGTGSFAGGLTALPNDSTAVPSHVAPVKYQDGSATTANTRIYFGQFSQSVSAVSAGTLAAINTLTFPVAFSATTAYAITCTVEGNAVVPILSSKAVGSISIGLYAIQTISANTVLVNWIAVGD